MKHARFLLGLGVGAVAASVAFAAWAMVSPKPPAVQTMLGHFAYPVANPRKLVPVDRAGDVMLRPAAARAFKQMQSDAKKAGLTIVPVSGYRSLSHQERLFFDLAAKPGETIVERAKTCAPPGFSEHHTGYSLDLGDGAYSRAPLKFKDTRAFRWLLKHASKYNFELSFPENNRQGLSYEPWHWRFVGDQQSFRTFYYARLKP